ncbi:Acetylcholine receptor subunit alpha-like 1 [Mizuhopecten yessoensis]|uniref:Acetylcholine receptor subunit alpha-like 1 n=1 Tax=Mizuhopecten yessoensis TaxID=6573 RepID=A0A210Q8C5_MIZYE|nr:Acetylcholine receptor subunit alpha-like 1 [Mizuhopecten yessoensis]
MCPYMTSIFLAVLTIFPWLQTVSCSAANNTRLLTDLLKDYQKFSRPGVNYSVPTSVSIEFELLAIRDFVELTNRFAISGVFELSWIDERMSWDPDNYGGIEEVHIPQNLAWKPELINTKPFSAVKAIGIPTFGIIYHFSGEASWNPGDNYDTPCEADVTYYPFDSQVCSLRFADWTQISGTTKFVSSSSELGLGLYVTNPVWDISRTVMTMDHDEFGHFVFFDIHFKRLHGFYVLNLILPICLISLVNIFVFVLPAESGERIGFSITVFLALSVLLTIMSEHLPKASRPRIAIVCYLIFFQTTISIFVLLATIVSLRFFFTPKYVEVPRFWQRFVQIVSLKSACRRTKRQISNTKGETKQIPFNKEMLTMDLEDSKESNDKNNIRKETEQQAFTERQTANTSERVTWAQVGLAFDKICMLVFLLVNVINIAIYFLIMYTNGKL